jgi:purine-binding chemotaxis protein CheW
MTAPAAAADTFILCTVADTAYAVSSEHVQHMEMVEQVTPVPNAPPFIDGVVFSRGQVVPVVNLRARFGFPRVAPDLRARLVIVRAEGRVAGLVVDAAREFVRIPPSSIQPPPEHITGLSGRYLAGVATLGERLVLVLELQEILKAEHLMVD